jgi:hypothetical protein
MHLRFFKYLIPSDLLGGGERDALILYGDMHIRINTFPPPRLGDLQDR